jgi:hypothetical protein
MQLSTECRSMGRAPIIEAHNLHHWLTLWALLEQQNTNIKSAIPPAKLTRVHTICMPHRLPQLKPVRDVPRPCERRLLTAAALHWLRQRASALVQFRHIPICARGAAKHSLLVSAPTPELLPQARTLYIHVAHGRW